MHSKEQSPRVLAALLIAACGGEPAVDDSVQGVESASSGGVSMGGGALGGNAETTLLAQRVLEQDLFGDLAWVTHETRLDAGETLEHTHEFAFVYARDAAHVLGVGPDNRQLGAGEGAAVEAGTAHRHGASDAPSLFWEVRLAAPGSAPPPNTANAQLVFESDPLEGIPSNLQATFVLVLVPVGGETSVHTHPGPELIYQLTGRINYENAIIGVREMGPGTIEGIPPRIAVQKRNPFEQDASFLSWFLVDSVQPFASPARFGAPDLYGENVAQRDKGAQVAGTSSVFGGGDNDSAWGANMAIDGDPTTQWSSDGDGDGAWIEIELPVETHVTAIGFWTRTMGTSAQILSFRVVTDRGEVDGPFRLDNASSIYRFETDLIAKRLRFEAVDTSGGNTGAVEIEVYGDPAPRP